MQRHIPLVGLCLAVFLIMTGMGMAVVALPEKFLRSSGPVQSSGWLAAIFAVSYMLCQYPAGRFADKYGYRQVLALGCFLIALSAIVFSVAQTPVAIYAGRFIQGAGEAPIWALAPALLGRLYPTMKGRVIGFYNAVFHLGLMLGPVIGAMVDTGEDPFLAFAVLSFTAMLLVLVSLRKSTPKRDAKPIAASFPAAPGRRIWPVVCGVPLFGAVYGLLVSCFPVHLATTASFSPKSLGAFFFYAYSGIATAQLVGGTLSDRYGRRSFILGGLMLISGGLFCFVLSPLRFSIATAAIMGLGLGMFAVSSMACINESCPDNRRGTASGLFYLTWGTGYFMGPLWVDQAGLFTGVLTLATYALAVSLLILWRFKASKTPQRAEV